MAITLIDGPTLYDDVNNIRKDMKMSWSQICGLVDRSPNWLSEACKKGKINSKSLEQFLSVLRLDPKKYTSGTVKMEKHSHRRQDEYFTSKEFDMEGFKADVEKYLKNYGMTMRKLEDSVHIRHQSLSIGIKNNKIAKYVLQLISASTDLDWRNYMKEKPEVTEVTTQKPHDEDMVYQLCRIAFVLENISTQLEHLTERK